MISDQAIFLRLLTAAILAAIIGANRSRLEWAAGMRTHMLVGVGSALAVIVSAYGFEHALTQPHVVLDPSRIAAQVISGIGFLGAGTILFLQKEQVVRGLTTAAGLWAVATVGLASGAGLYFAALSATLMLWIILALLKPFEQRFVKTRRRYNAIQLVLERAVPMSAVEQKLLDHNVSATRILSRKDAVHQGIINLRFGAEVSADQLSALGDALGAIDGVMAVAILPLGQAR